MGFFVGGTEVLASSSTNYSNRVISELPQGVSANNVNRYPGHCKGEQSLFRDCCFAIPAATAFFAFTINNLHPLYLRRLREAATGRSSGFRIVLLITPSHSIGREQWHGEICPRIQRRVRSSSHFKKHWDMWIPFYSHAFMRKNYL